jgi:PAS domain S-box-containing protein
LKTAVRLILGSRYPMFVWWGEDLTKFYNDAYIPVLGKRHAQALGKPASEVWAEIWDTLGPQTATVLHEGRSTWNRELLLIMERNGYPEETYFTFSYSPVASDDGSVGGVFCACSEDTQRVLGDRRLATLRELAAETIAAKTAAAACEIAAAVLSRNPRDIPFALFYLLEADRSAARLASTTGLAAGTIASPEQIELISAQTPDNWQLQQAIATGEIQIVEDLATKFGLLPGGAWAESPRTAAVMPLIRSGETLGAIVIGVNPLRILDDDCRGFFDLVAGQVTTAIANALAYQQQQQRAEALAELDRAKTTFFNNISHEFRTPLTLMLGPIEEALNDRGTPLPPQHRERLEVVQRNGLRLQKLVNTLLDFSRIEAGRIEAVCEPTDLAAFTAELASVFRSAIERANLRLTIDCPPLPALVWVDRQMWEKIVLNLLSNAFKFTFEGEIAVILQQCDSQIQLEVRDTGSGIPPEELPRIFERFHRVRGASGRSYEGSGIGLSLVQELVKLHGGTIAVTSEVDRGTTFTVSIPADREYRSPSLELAELASTPTPAVAATPYVEEALRWLPEAEQHNTNSDTDARMNDRGVLRESDLEGIRNQESGNILPISPSPPPPLPPFPTRILLADDNSDMRDYVKRLLLEAGYAVETASDGLEAWRAIEGQPPDLVLSDVMMPKLDGFGLLRELRANPNTKDLPIVLLSARAGGEAQIEGLTAGADDYLTKPFAARELLGRVAACLQQAQFRREAREREQALRQEAETAKARIESILSSIRDGFFVLDREWRYTYTNDRNCEIVGMQREQLLGSNLWELFPDVVGTEVWEKFDRAVREQMPVQFEYYYPTWNRWFEYRVYPNASGLSVFVADISDRRQTAAALQESQRFNQQIAETLPGILFVHDAIEQRHVYINSQVGELLGYTSEQILEMGSEIIPKILHPDEMPQIALYLQQCNASKPAEAKEIELRVLNARGEWRWFLHRTVVFSRTPEGQARQILGFGIDITDRKRIEQELRQTNQTLSTLIAASPLAIALIKPDGTVMLWNQAAENLFGWKASEVLGRPIPSISEEQIGECLKLWQAVTAGEKLLGLETYRQKRDGSRVIVSISAAPLYAENGSVSEILLIFQDITAQKQAEAALRRLNERFEMAMQAVDGIVFEWNLADKAVYRSEGLFQLVGVKPEDAEPTREWWIERVDPEDLSYLESKFGSISKADRYQDEYRVRHQDGSWVYVWERGCFHRDDRGEIVRVVGFTANITDRKLAEAALKESEERYRYLVESIPQLVWMADIEGTLQDINQRWSDYTGMTLAEVQVAGWQAVVHPEDLPELVARWDVAQQARNTYQAEGRMRRHDGTYRWYLHQAIPIADERGQVIKWFGTATDIHDRKQAESALRASEARFRNLADNAPFMVWVTEPTGYCTYLSQSWYDFTGQTEASGLGFGWLNATHTEDRQVAERTFLAANDRQEPFRLEYRLRRCDGEYIWAIDAASPRFSAEGEFQGFVGSVIDITDRKQAEAQRDLLLRQEQAARAEAEKANRIKDEFLAVLSHELRSPLNPILGWSKLLQSGRLDPQKTKLALETIERNAKLQTQLIEDLLDVSRILQGKLVLNQAPVLLTNTVEAAMETVRLAAEAKGIHIQKSLNLPGGKVLGDSARLQQVIWNLLSNAIKFTPAGGAVEIRLAQIDNCAQIQVIDRGKGIKPEFLPYVFEYFRQEDGTTTRRFGGLGLGLAIVRYLTELHGGTVGAESPGEGLGATFTVRLPLIPDATKTLTDNSQGNSSIDLAGLRILVVDDEPDLRDIVSFILEDAGACVSIASSALAALNSIEQSLPDVLVCDIGMPEMDGYMLMRLLRGRSAAAGGEIPAIALTAYAGEGDRQSAIAAGFQCHLAKPVTPEELIAAVKSLVE